MSRRWGGLFVIVVLLGLATPQQGSAANTHGTSTEAAERQRWFGDFMEPRLQPGTCMPPVPVASLSLAVPLCQGYVRTTEGALVYVTQDAHSLGPLNGGDGTYWLALHADGRTTVAGWTREAGTHLLWQQMPTQQADPPGALVYAQILVAGGVITTVNDLGRATAPAGMVSTAPFTRTLGKTGAALQAAIDALPPAGGTVYIEPGVYTLTQRLRLGNGAAGTLSSRSGIVLEGLGRPGATAFDWPESPRPVQLEWLGGNDWMVAIEGPLLGWGLHNLHLDGKGVADAGIYVQSGQMGQVSNVTIVGQRYAGIFSTCVATWAGSGVTDSLQNQWNNVRIWMRPPVIAGASGVVLGSASATCDTDVNTFQNLFVIVQGVAAYGVFLGAADSNMFSNLHITSDGSAVASIHFAHDNGVSDVWPSGNVFYGVHTAMSPITTSGTPPAVGQSAPNVFFGLDSQGGDPPLTIDGPSLGHVGGDPATRDLVLAAPQAGNLRLFTTTAHPRHVLPSVDSLMDLGSSTARFRALHTLGVRRPLRAETSGTTLDADTDWYVQVFPGAPDVVTLADAVAACGKDFHIKNISGFNVTVTPQVGQLIDGQAGYVLNAVARPAAIHILSDCLNWQILSEY